MALAMSSGSGTANAVQVLLPTLGALSVAYLLAYRYPDSFFFFQAEDVIRVFHVTGVQTCALPIYQTPGEEVAHRADVGGGARQQLPGLGLVVPCRLQRQEMAAEPVAEVVLDVGADPAGDVAAEPAEDPPQHRQA